MTLFVAPVVEGQTERDCVERLLHRVWRELLGRSDSDRLQVLEPFEVKRQQVAAPESPELKKAVSKSLSKLKAKADTTDDARSLVLILLDADTDCPADLGPRLLKTVEQDIPNWAKVSCVLPRRMFENWIVAGASTLAGVKGLPDPLPARDRVEEFRGDARLNAQLRSRNKASKYKKTVDAPEFVSRMDLAECERASRSFRKLVKELRLRLPPPPAPEPAP